MAMVPHASEIPQPGRSCPLHYRYSPADLARKADFRADTLYVVGGLYGNQPALQTILELALREPGEVRIVFNGDFNWFNIDEAGFENINREVLRHHALRGNVETEIANDDASAGCGCAYPEWVCAAEVEYSNEIILRLRDRARRSPALRARLAALPMHRVADVGSVRIAIVHGDLESLAGWSLAQETLAAEDAKAALKKQLLMSECRIVASSHTCLPVALAMDTPAGQCVVINNGAAGMPNFRGGQYGVITRIATLPARHTTPLYMCRVDDVYVEALQVGYDAVRWEREFLFNWPAGSPAHQSYYRRITEGPAYEVAQANRL